MSFSMSTSRYKKNSRFDRIKGVYTVHTHTFSSVEKNLGVVDLLVCTLFKKVNQLCEHKCTPSTSTKIPQKGKPPAIQHSYKKS